MASYIYTNPLKSTVQTERTERVVISTQVANVPQRGGRYIGGSIEPIVEVTARVKRASK